MPMWGVGRGEAAGGRGEGQKGSMLGNSNLPPETFRVEGGREEGKQERCWPTPNTLTPPACCDGKEGVVGGSGATGAVTPPWAPCCATGGSTPL
jgi:hypothetical protein